MNPHNISIKKAYRVLKPFEDREFFFLREIKFHLGCTIDNALTTVNALLKIGLVEIVDSRKPRQYRVTRNGKIFIKTFEGVLN